MNKTIGVLALARPTFDVAYANTNYFAMQALFAESNCRFESSGELLMDGAAATGQIDKFAENPPDLLLILQVTFTDASAIVEAANKIDAPIAIWAIPEPRLGGRLRLNSFCGLNLASHALGLAGKAFSWIYCDPTSETAPVQFSTLLKGDREEVGKPPQAVYRERSNQKPGFADRVRGAKICRIGDHPPGFDTCSYDPTELLNLSGVTVDELEIDQLFEEARTADLDSLNEVSQHVSEKIDNIGELDAGELDNSLRLKVALDEIRKGGGYDAFAIRCWPETFTEYGGAVCGPVSLLGEARVPCACEADVYGALTQLYLQRISDSPVFLVDIVDMDVQDDTAVVWHCGQAPVSMADPEYKVEGTIHTNRKMPLLFEFPLKPGEVTFLRISQAFGEPKLILAKGRMLKRPMAYTGTSGVVRFDAGTQTALQNLIGSGMEHHMAFTYGNFREELLMLAEELQLPVLELG